MSYNLDLPPKVRRTNQTDGESPDDWVLETASGTQIETYTRVGMSVEVWWGDLLVYIKNNASSIMDAVEDITLLMMQEDWSIEQ